MKLQCMVLIPLPQNTVVLRTLVHSAAKGLISSREYLDLATHYRDYEGGLYFTCGKKKKLVRLGTTV